MPSSATSVGSVRIALPFFRTALSEVKPDFKAFDGVLPVRQGCVVCKRVPRRIPDRLVGIGFVGLREFRPNEPGGGGVREEGSRERTARPGNQDLLIAHMISARRQMHDFKPVVHDRP